MDEDVIGGSERAIEARHPCGVMPRSTAGAEEFCRVTAGDSQRWREGESSGIEDLHALEGGENIDVDLESRLTRRKVRVDDRLRA